MTWRKISDGGPAYDEHVLLRSQDGSILQGFRTVRGYVTRFSNYVMHPTHWMPCPAPPPDPNGELTPSIKDSK